MVNINSKVDQEDICILEISGEIDASSSIHLDNAMKKAVSEGFKKIIVDCDQLEYISSAGLGVFMSYIQEFKNLKISLVLSGLNENVFSVFEILGLDQLLVLEDTVEKAKKKVNENP
ncbi:MAG: STAS domain-containing protein [Cyclobacteriaceae bacterium]|nr:STAS domain-containing protein [Cyclobacteriaceae bacterium]MCH8516529.1 STAS domain-containing protein [Cyclobacteriaceae bacterium]